MGQWEVYEAIHSLGGRATFAQIKEYLQNKYRHCSDSSAHGALQKLICNGLVSCTLLLKGNCRRVYYITGEFPERNVIVVENGVSRSAAA